MRGCSGIPIFRWLMGGGDIHLLLACTLVVRRGAVHWNLSMKVHGGVKARLFRAFG